MPKPTNYEGTPYPDWNLSREEALRIAEIKYPMDKIQKSLDNTFKDHPRRSHVIASLTNGTIRFSELTPYELAVLHQHRYISFC